MLKDELKVFCVENGSKSLLEIEPMPEEPDYVVVGKLNGAEGPNKCLRYNNDETILLGNTSTNILAYKVLPEKGVQPTSVNIQTTTQPMNETLVEFEDYVAIGNNGVITGNSLGVLEGFEYNVVNGTQAKRFEYNINEGMPPNLYQQITSMSLSDDQKYLAVATAIDNQRVEGCLNKLIVFSINPEGLRPVDTKEFSNSNPDSLYFFINFDYRYRGSRLIMCFQADDQMRLDAYSFDNENIELIHTVYNYHKNVYSAIRGMSGNIISVDYEGEMKILSIPE